MLSPKQVAYKLQVSYKTVMRLIKRRQLSAYRIGRHYKISEDALEDYINKNISCDETVKVNPLIDDIMKKLKDHISILLIDEVTKEDAVIVLTVKSKNIENMFSIKCNMEGE